MISTTVFSAGGWGVGKGVPKQSCFKRMFLRCDFSCIYVNAHVYTCMRIHLLMHVHTHCAQSCLTLGDPMDCQAPLRAARLLCPWGFSRQEYWNGLLLSPPGDLPNPGIKPRFPSLQVDFLSSEPPGRPRGNHKQNQKTCRLEENVCDLNDKGLDFKIHKQLIHLNNKKTNNLIK